MSRGPVDHGGRGGFVLAVVVFMLFAISVAGAAGYIVVNTEFSMATHSSQGEEAVTVARAGLHRFIAESIGVVGDSVSYAIGDGVALITSRKISERDSLNHLYYIRSEGSVFDVRTPDTPARRVVGAHAWHRKRPLAPHAEVVIATNTIEVDDGGEIDGADRDNPTACLGGGADPITGAIASVSVTEDDSDDIQGAPDSEIWSGGFAEIFDSVGLRWDVLQDPDFPLEFDGVMPNFGSIPADSFPVVRMWGWPSANWTGRGVLIMPFRFDPSPSFNWDGIVLAGEVDDIIQGHLDGLLVAGLDGPNPYTTIDFRTRVHYHSCAVYGANESLSYLEIIENSVFEAS